MVQAGHQEATRSARHPPLVSPALLLAVAILLFGSVQVFISLHKYYTLQANTMDLGYFEQVLWKIAHGDWWAYSTVFHTPALGADGCVWLYPLAYAFRYLGGAVVLFVVQAVGTGLASWGLYRAARIHHLGPWTAALVASVFLIYPAVLGGSQFDFHPDFLALPAFVWAYVAYEENRRVVYYLLLAAAALSKNMVLFSFIGWGGGLILCRRRVRDGLIVLTSSIGLLAAELLWIIPVYLDHGSEALNLTLYHYLGTGFVGVATGLVTRFPTLVAHLATEPIYALWIFGPVLGLALGGAASLPAALALFGLNAISSFSAQHQVNDQYQVLLAGWLFLALIEALTRWPHRRRILLGAIAVTTMVFEGLMVSLYILPLFAPTVGRVAAVERATRHIAPTSIVWTQSRLGPIAYRFRVMGMDWGAVDGLPAVWREGAARGLDRTALLGERPTTPYFAVILHRALAAGYRVTYHAGGLFVVTGTRHFPVPSRTTGLGWQPASASWTMAAWTQASAVGRVNWATHTVAALLHHAGTLVGPVFVVLNPGTYRLSLAVQTPAPVPSRTILGRFSAGHTGQMIRVGATQVTLRITVARRVLVNLAVTTTGADPFQIHSIRVARLPAVHP